MLGVYFTMEQYKIYLNPYDFDVSAVLSNPLTRPNRYVDDKQNKLSQIAWSFVELENNQKSKQVDRKIVGVTGLAIDYDSGALIEDIHNLFKPYKHYIHTSWSHTPEKHKFRLILPLKKSIPYDLYCDERFIDELKKLFKHCDPSTFSVTRQMFMPCTGPYYRYILNDGKLLDVSSLEKRAMASIPFKTLGKAMKQILQENTIYSLKEVDWNKCEKELNDIINLPDGSGRYFKIVSWLCWWVKYSQNPNQVSRILEQSNYDRHNKRILLKHEALK